MMSKYITNKCTECKAPLSYFIKHEGDHAFSTTCRYGHKQSEPQIDVEDSEDAVSIRYVDFNGYTEHSM